VPAKSRYGYFDNKAGEFVITSPCTPTPWINYLGCQDILDFVHIVPERARQRIIDLASTQNHDGLRIDPCVPPDWKKFAITRKFRGATYNIKVFNPDGAMRGVKKMLVNGKVQPGNLVEVFKPGSVVNVEIYLG